MVTHDLASIEPGASRQWTTGHPSARDWADSEDYPVGLMCRELGVSQPGTTPDKAAAPATTTKSTNDCRS